MSTNNPIQSTLQSLLPTTNLLPTPLLSLTTSLLAQSRSKAPRLKQDEEIARIYVVCVIAVTKYNALQSKSGRGEGGVVEMGKIMAPCRKIVFDKLRAWFEGLLVVDSRDGGGGTPRGRGEKRGVDVEGSGSGSGKRRKVESEAVSSVSVGRRRGREEVRGLPAWVSPVVRMVCEGLEVRKAVPHVFVGVETLFRGGKVEEEDLLVTVFVVFMWTVSKMKGWNVEEEIAEENMEELISRLREWNQSTERKGKVKDMPELDAEQVLPRIHQVMELADKDEWMSMEWFHNIPVEDDVGEDMEETPKRVTAKTPLGRKEKRAKYDADGEEMPGPAGLLPGLGTMFQPALNWLSDERRAQLAQWKKQTLKEIARLESITA